MRLSFSLFIFLLNSFSLLANAENQTCKYHSYEFRVGDGFPSATDCNGCKCMSGGAISCTEMACNNYKRISKLYGPFCVHVGVLNKGRIFIQKGSLILIDKNERPDDRYARGLVTYVDSKGRSLSGPNEMIYGDFSKGLTRIPEMKLCVCESADNLVCSDAKKQTN